MFQTVVNNKLGILIKPNWRYEALLYPEKYKLQEHISRASTKGISCGALKRYVGSGLLFDLPQALPEELEYFFSVLTKEQKQEFQVLWLRNVKRNKLKKLKVEYSKQTLKGTVVWSLKNLDKITDKSLVRIIKHVSHFECDPYIAQALALYTSPDYTEIIKFIGYCLYAKISEKEIAKRWQLPLKTITYLKLLFFDFSKFPKDRIANFTYLRQLVNNGTIAPDDFAYYKRVFELGELGLKAQTDFHNLSQAEQLTIEEYLGKSVLTNTFNINFNIRTQSDALSYGAVISSLSTYYVKRSEIEYFKEKTKNISAITRRIEGEQSSASEIMTDNDRELLALVREHSLQDSEVVYKHISELK